MALSFDGTNDTLDFGDLAALDAPTAFTISFDYLPTAGRAVNDGLFEKRTAGTNGLLMYLSVANTTIALSFLGTTNFGSVASMLTADVWGHHLWTYDGAGGDNATKLQYYKDGVAQAISFTGTIPAGVIDSTTAQLSLMENAVGGLFTPGVLANFMVFTGHMSAAVAAQQARSRRPVRTSDLYIWCPLDGADPNDYSGAGRNGTIVGAVVADGPPREFGARPKVI